MLKNLEHFKGAAGAWAGHLVRSSAAIGTDIAGDESATESDG